jgi:hypothetical protein
MLASRLSALPGRHDSSPSQFEKSSVMHVFVWLRNVVEKQINHSDSRRALNLNDRSVSEPARVVRQPVIFFFDNQ